MTDKRSWHTGSLGTGRKGHEHCRVRSRAAIDACLSPLCSLIGEGWGLRAVEVWSTQAITYFPHGIPPTVQGSKVRVASWCST